MGRDTVNLRSTFLRLNKIPTSLFYSPCKGLYFLTEGDWAAMKNLTINVIYAESNDVCFNPKTPFANFQLGTFSC